jgi:hypothetical protein
MAIMSYLSDLLMQQSSSEARKTPNSKANQWAVAVAWYIEPHGPGATKGQSYAQKSLGGLPQLKLVHPVGGEPLHHAETRALGHHYESTKFSVLRQRVGEATAELSAIFETAAEPNALYVHSIFSPCEACSHLLAAIPPCFPGLKNHLRFSYNYLWHTDNHPNGIQSIEKATLQLHRLKDAGWKIRSFPPGGTKTWFDPSTLE